MKRGLVIGKFLQVHQGHLALIRFAVQQCDELIVSMSHRADDPIDHIQRSRWLRELLKDDPRIKVHEIVDDFDREDLALDERTQVWAAVMRRVYPAIDIVISSESYGEPFAKNLGAIHIMFDPDRARFPVSATRIRQDPFRYWDFIPVVVRPFFVKKICIYGPESTGKSTLVTTLAQMFNTTFVPEVAREMLVTNDFTVGDIVAIGLAHAERIRIKAETANKILFCDTDVITTQIYSRHYLNVVPDVLYRLERETTYDHYFLLDIDVPWVADGLRDLGHKRDEMFTIFKYELDRRNITYTLLQGGFEERTMQVKQWVIENLRVQPVYDR